MSDRSTIGSHSSRAAIWLGAMLWCCALLFPRIGEAQSCSRNMLRISGPQSYVATPDVQALHLTHGFTIECWARLDSTSAPLAAIADKGTYGIFLQNDSSLSGLVQHSTSIRIIAPVDSMMKWHHYALVFTPSDSVRLYVDSAEAASVAFSTTTLDSNTDSLRIGISASGQSWMGAIDEFRVWNVPRTLASITQSMFHTLAGTELGLVLYYPFDDETNAVRIHDFSGHAHDGFIRGSNAVIIPSSSPVIGASRGWRLVAVESSIVIPAQRCSPSFDTVIHVRNLGATPLLVDTASFFPGSVFSIEPNAPFTLPADSNVIDSLRLHFEANAGGTFYDSLYISSSDTCGGAIRIGIRATYDSVGLITSTDTIRFDSVTQCSRDTIRTITVRNTSSTDSVTILGASIPSGSGLRMLDSFPISLAKNSSTQLTIALTHGGRGLLNTTIALILNKCFGREVMIPVTALRKVEALSMPSAIDFGSAPATLAGVTRDDSVVVTNSGDTWTSIARAQAGPSGFLQVLGKGRQGVQMGPGDTVHLHVRLTAAGCGSQVGKLQVTSANCVVEASAFAVINLIPPAPVMSLSADMGTTCSQKDTFLYVTNPNSIPLRIDSITYSSPAFANGPVFHDTIAAGDSIPIEFLFNANQSGDYRDTVYFHTTPCGTGMSVLSGNWGYANISFDTAELLFGRGCNTTPITETATLTNHTSRTVTLTNDSLTGSQRFQLEPFGFLIVLDPGSSRTFTILYSPVLGHLDTAHFLLYSPEGCSIASLFLRGSRELAKAAWLEPGNFDTICPGDTVERTFHLLDKGIDSISVLAAQVTGVGFSMVNAPTVFSGVGSFRVRFAPTLEQQYSGMLTVTADSCGRSFQLPLLGSGGPLPLMLLSDTNYDFGNLRVGDSSEFCFAISNPSCTPISVQFDSTALAGTPFQVLSGDSGMISRGSTKRLCIQFKPTSYGNVAGSLTIRSDSIAPKHITVRGTGLAPDIRFYPNMLDFGYVLHNDSKVSMIYDTNVGNETSSIIASHDPAKPFAIQPPNSLAPNARDSFAVTFTPTSTTGLVYDTLYLIWNGRRDSVILRGFGTEPGLQLSAVGLDFGAVHVGNDSTLPLYLYARTQFPKIDHVAMKGGNSVFAGTTSQPLPYTIQNDSDTLTINVTYHAHSEQLDSDSLLIYSGPNVWSVPLVGRGVEAHPKVNGAYFNFGSVTIGQSITFHFVDLKDTGGYQLFVDSLKPDTVFETTPDLPTVPIAPDSVRHFSTTFRPVRARRVVDTLQFTTSSPDAVPPVILVGTGVYPAGTGPSFGYSVASDTVEPGDTARIPVYMNGIRLDKIDADSLTLDFSFDPQMVRMVGATEGTGTVPVTHFTQFKDDSVQATIATNQFNSGILMQLRAEALLGPHPLSYIRVANSSPTADQPEAANDGAFFVADCGGAIHGVVFAGPYGTSALVPNPVSEQAKLPYTLGLDGPVALNIYNAIGELVRHIDAGAMKVGTHTLTIDVSDLPPGRYMYRLTSLEYQAEGSMVILR